MGISLKSLKDEIKKSGTSKGKILFFKEDTKMRVRFLTDLEDGLEIKFHDSFKLAIDIPCQEIFGRECEYCENNELRERNKYAWCVYDYESKDVKILLQAVNNCSPVPMLTSMYESYGTLTDRDYEIKQIGSGTNKSFSIVPLDKSRFKNTKAKPLSETAILKLIDKAFPDENATDDEGDEDEKPKAKRTNKTNKKPLKGKMNEPEEDEWEDEEDETPDYSEMTPKELYALCKERDITCKPKKAKEYYIDLLEESDEDGWEDEDEEDWEE